MSGGKDASVLQVKHNGPQAYEWTFHIPPPSTINANLDVVPVHSNLGTDLKFATGILSKIDHFWKFHIYRKDAGIELFIRDVKQEFGFVVHPCELQMLEAGHLKEQVRFQLRNFGFVDVSNKVYHKRGCSIPISETVWNDAVDTLKVVLNIQCEQGKFVNVQEVDVGLINQRIPNAKELKADDFFLSTFLSDVTLVAEDQEFPAHRFLLACKSPVFKCMFQHKMKESTESRVVIDDIRPKVLKEMLRFLYTGGLAHNNTVNEMRVELFKSADKYGMDPLKFECVKLIMEKVTFKNALETYILGNTHNEALLMQKAVELMKQNKKQAIPDDETLQEMVLNYPKLAYELFNA